MLPTVLKQNHTKTYQHKMRSKQFGYSTAAGPYCTTHYVKVQIFMPELSSSNTISHCFHIDNNEGDLIIGYYMNMGQDLIVKIGLTGHFKK